MIENNNICIIGTPSKTAILFFSRSASVEARKKRFGLSYSDAVRVHNSIQWKVRSTLSRSTFHIEKSDESNQVGTTYGIRLTNAIKHVWEKGYKKCIVVGGDVPDLDLTDLYQAQHALDSGKSILGEDQRGGVYIIGIQQASFRESEFANLPWQTNNLAAALKETLCQWEKARLSDCTCILRSCAKVDCNEAVDLVKISCHLPLLIRLSRRCSALKSNQAFFLVTVTSIDLEAISQRRGPPVFRLRAA